MSAINLILAGLLVLWEVATTGGGGSHAATLLIYYVFVVAVAVLVYWVVSQFRRFGWTIWIPVFIVFLLTGCSAFSPTGDQIFANPWTGPASLSAAAVASEELTEQQRAVVEAVEQLFLERGLLTDDKWHDPPPGQLKSPGWRGWLDKHHRGGFAAWSKSNRWVAAHHVGPGWPERQAIYSALLRPWAGDYRLLEPGDALKDTQQAWGRGTSTKCPALPLTQNCRYYMATLDRSANGLHKDCEDDVVLAAIDAVCGRTPPPPPVDPPPVEPPDPDPVDPDPPVDPLPNEPETTCVEALDDLDAILAAAAAQLEKARLECRP